MAMTFIHMTGVLLCEVWIYTENNADNIKEKKRVRKVLLQTHAYYFACTLSLTKMIFK